MSVSDNSGKTVSSPARGGPQSVGRIFAILEALSASKSGASLAELAVDTGAPKTSLVGLLAGLTEEECLVRDEGGRYFLGPRFVSLAMQVAGGRELSALVRPVLKKLVEQTGETAVLGALASDADVAHYLDRVESTNSIRYAVTVGERRELYCTSMGKTLLAYFPEERLQQYLESVERLQFTENTIVDMAALRAELGQIRAERVARTSDEWVRGASGLGAPIFSRDGTVVAALVVAGPTDRFMEHAKEHEKFLVEAAAECTRLTGGRMPEK